MKCIQIILLCCLTSSVLFGQNSTDVGIEIQAYPAGLIMTGKVDFGFQGHHGAHFRLGYNAVDRQDFSEFNDNEEGGGFGISAGYRYYFKPAYQGFFIGGRTDLWWLEIDWIDQNTLMSTGVTNITVFQPTAELGYQWILNDKWGIAPAIALGYEINIKTEGEAVGEGAISLLDVSFMYRF